MVEVGRRPRAHALDHELRPVNPGLVGHHVCDGGQRPRMLAIAFARALHESQIGRKTRQPLRTRLSKSRLEVRRADSSRRKRLGVKTTRHRHRGAGDARHGRGRIGERAIRKAQERVHRDEVLKRPDWREPSRHARDREVDSRRGKDCQRQVPVISTGCAPTR